MGALAIPPIDTQAVPSTKPVKKTDDPAEIRSAAEQFETLLIGQILHSARESGAGWMGAPGDDASDCATDYAEQQLAAVMAQAGGFGLVHLIEQGLRQKAAAPNPETAASGGAGAGAK